MTEDLYSTIADTAVLSENRKNREIQIIASELQDQTYEARIRIADQLLVNQTKDNERRSLRQKSLPADIPT